MLMILLIICWSCLQVSAVKFSSRYAVSSKDRPSFIFPKYDYQDILSMDSATAMKISHDLTSLGFLQIDHIPRYAEARLEALQAAHDCFQGSQRDEDHIQRTTMVDGSLRLTASAISSDGIGEALSNQCAQSSSSTLRALIENVTRQLFRLLDNAAVSSFNKKSNNPVMDPYRSYSDLIAHGEHLEHLHVYYPSENPTLDQPTIDMHTDNGIMIAMTTGYYRGENIADDRGLYVELPNGQVCKASLDDDSLVIMVGAGARWLSPILGASLRPVPHALVSGMTNQGSSRAWFGKMILPPVDAILRDDSSRDNSMTFGKYRRLTSIPNNYLSLPTGCGMNEETDTYSLLSTSECLMPDGTKGLMCWKKCSSVAGLSCGLDAECVYLATNEVVNGDEMCPVHEDGACELECVDVTPDNSNSNSSTFDAYCYGTGTSMLMDGFTTMAFSDRGSVPCINLFFTSWTLDSELKFGFGCVGIFFMGILVQWMTMFRQQIKKGKTKASMYTNAVFTVFIYGVQVMLSYFIMLAAMTYSAELFAMVCVGLTVGYAAFHMEMPTKSPDQCCDIDIDVEEIDRSKLYQKLRDPDGETSTESVNN